MKIDNYKGFEIEVTREKCLGGWYMLYYYILRKSDGWFLADGFWDSDDTVKEGIKSCKSIIEDYLENPEDYED
jgi:hypothetical protein